MSPSERKPKQRREKEQDAGAEQPSEPDRLREEIDETREELGDTVEALAEKADVKGQAQEKMDERKEQFRQAQEQTKAKVGEATQQAQERPLPVAAIAAAVLVVLFVWLRRRR